MPEGTVGFIYKITHIKSGKFYIGKKQLYSTVTKKLTKKEILEQKGPGRKSTKKQVISESNWLVYTGSSKKLNKVIEEEGRDKFKFEIISFCSTKRQLTYREVKFQILNECLEKPEATFNENILGKFFPEDI